MISETAGLRLAAAMEVLAVSHLLERISPVLQEAYPKLRSQYLKSTIRILPKQNALVVSFPEAGSVRVTETPGGRYRIKCSRGVPDGTREKMIEVSRTCQTVQDLLYQIDKIFERTASIAHDMDRVAKDPAGYAFFPETIRLKHAVDLGVAEHMADEFFHFLEQGGNPEYLSSDQVGLLLGKYIEETQEHNDQPVSEETWRSMMRSLEDKYDIRIDAEDLELALKQVSK